MKEHGAIPGAFGYEKTDISQELSKVITLLLCSHRSISTQSTEFKNPCSTLILKLWFMWDVAERGNEMAEILMDFPQSTMTFLDMM